MSRYGSSDDPGQADDESTGRADYRGQARQPYGPPPVPAGPEYQPSEAPTHYANYTNAGQQQPADQAPTHYANYTGPEQPRPGDKAHESTGFPAITEPEHKPWFRRRWVLIGWLVLIAIMIALVFWGIVQLTSRGPGKVPAPSTTSSTTSAATTTVTTTTTTTQPPAAPPPGGGAPPHQPPHPPAHPPVIEPPHRPHLPPLPSVITIPPIPRAPEVPTVITLPGR